MTMLDRVARLVALEICEATAAQRKQMKYPDDFNGDTIDRATSCARSILEVIGERPNESGGQ